MSIAFLGENIDLEVPRRKKYCPADVTGKSRVIIIYLGHSAIVPPSRVTQETA